MKIKINGIEYIVEKIIKETFDEKYIAVVKGDYTVNSQLLDLQFNYIFFTIVNN